MKTLAMLFLSCSACFGQLGNVGFLASLKPISDNCTSVLDTNYTTGTATYQIGSASGNEYAGQTTFDPGASVDICKVEANLSANGTITSFNYVCEIWTIAANNLQSKVATSTSVPGAAWSSTLVTFPFSSGFVTNGISYAVVITKNAANDAANYAILNRGPNTELSGSTAIFNASGTRIDLTGTDALFNIYRR